VKYNTVPGNRSAYRLEFSTRGQVVFNKEAKTTILINGCGKPNPEAGDWA
jgi:hypothetical protein